VQNFQKGYSEIRPAPRISRKHFVGKEEEEEEEKEEEEKEEEEEEEAGENIESYSPLA